MKLKCERLYFRIKLYKFMNTDTRGAVDFSENRLKGNLLYLWELYIYWES